MQRIGLVRPFIALSRDSILRLGYTRIEILEGFQARVPRFGGRRALLTYSRRGRSVFRYYMSVDNLRELFEIMEYVCEGGVKQQQFVLGRYEFRLGAVDGIVTVGVDFAGHDVAIAGSLGQMSRAIRKYRGLGGAGRRGGGRAAPGGEAALGGR